MANHLPRNGCCARTRKRLSIAMPAKDFTHVRDWVFDLDHTLYPATSMLFKQLEVNMERFLMREFSLSQQAAAARRHSYWKQHGTTLAGLMYHHGTDPHVYLDEVQQIDVSVLAPNPPLRAAIAALPGRKIVFTNGSRDYAHRVTAALGLEDLFETHFGIDDAEFVSKPHASAFDVVFAKANLAHQEASMFEDDPRNLEIPHALGLKTVLVGHAQTAPHIDHQTDDLTAFLTAILEPHNAH